MRRLRLVTLVLSFALFLAILPCSSLAEILPAEDILASVEEMHPLQRLATVESLLELVAELDGEKALQRLLGSLESDASSNEPAEEVPVQDESLSAEEDLDRRLSQQPLYVSQVEYLEGDPQFAFLYPNVLSAIIFNNSEDDIKDAVVAFVAWDTNGLPVKLEGDMDFSSPSYLRRINFADINLIPNSYFGEGGGFAISEDCHVATFKAIVVSYETFEGKTWVNPLLTEFCELYEGKKLGR